LTLDYDLYSYLLPNRNKSSKQKTPVIKKTCNPRWNHTFVFEDILLDDLRERCLEVTIWDYDKLTSNDFLGGVRLSLGTGKQSSVANHQYYILT
jgi:bitesize isoform, putative